MNDKDNNIDPRELLSGDASEGNDPYLNDDGSDTWERDDSRSDASGSSVSQNIQLSCTLVLEILPEAVGGDLDEETLAIVARHIADCHACSREWVSLRNAYQSLQVLRETTSQMPGVDDEFFAGLHVDIIGEIRHQAVKIHDARLLRAAVPAAGPRSRSRVAAILPKLVALAATLMLGIFLGSMTGASDDGRLMPGNDNSNGPIHFIADPDATRLGIGDSDAMRVVRDLERELKNEFDKRGQKRREASNPKTLKTPPAKNDR